MANRALEVLRAKKEEEKKTLHAIEAVKMASMLALRNQGWSTKRLRRFNDDFNNILIDVSNGRQSLSDIADTIYDETGLGVPDLRVR